MCVALIVEHAGWGAEAAAPIARKLLDYHLLGVYPSEAEVQKISGVKPQAVQFQYAGGKNGVPAVPGAKPPPASRAAVTGAKETTQSPLPGRDGSEPAGAERAQAPNPAVEPWPAPAASTPRGPTTSSAPRAERTALDGRYTPARCQPGPLFTRFGAQHDHTDPDEGVRL